MAGGGSKPGERRGGRKAGTPNKLTATTGRNCDSACNPLLSDDARNYMVQGRDRRNVASRVLSPLAHLPAQVEGGE